MTDDPKLILWQNVQALMKSAYGAEALGRFAKDCGIGAATMTRIKKHKTSVGVDVLEQIGRHFNFKPWQLLAPNLGEGVVIDPEAVKALDVLRAALRSREHSGTTLLDPHQPIDPPGKKGKR